MGGDDGDRYPDNPNDKADGAIAASDAPPVGEPKSVDDDHCLPTRTPPSGAGASEALGRNSGFMPGGNTHGGCEIHTSAQG